MKDKDKKEEIINALKKGYLEYGELNLAYAEMCLEADNKVLSSSCEEKLSESE